MIGREARDDLPGSAEGESRPGARPAFRRRAADALSLRWPLLAIMLGGLLLRIALMPLTANLPNGLTDEGFWKHWMGAINQHGVLNIFRTTDTDYVGYHWVLWVVSMVYEAFSGSSYSNSSTPLHLLVKVPSLIFDVALTLVVYRATAMLLKSYPAGPAWFRHSPLIAAGIIAFQPAVLYDGAIWAQTDSAVTAAMLGAFLLAAGRRPFASGAVLALGLAVKPHPIVIAPLLLLLLWRHGGVGSLVRAALGGMLVTAVVLGPWILHGDLARIIDVYETLFTKERERLSELAWNVWWIYDQRGDPRPGDRLIGGVPLTFKTVALSLSLLAGGLAMLYSLVRPGLRHTLIAAAYIAFAFQALPIGTHERYLYPFLGLLLPVAMFEGRWRPLYAAVSVTFFLNLVVVAPPAKIWMDRWVYGDFGVAVAAINALLFASFTVMLVMGLELRSWPERVRGYAVRGGRTPQEQPSNR